MNAQRNRGRQGFVAAVAGQIGWPLLWGAAAWVGFYVLLQNGVIASPTLERYLAGHIVEYFETALFFVGLAALGIKFADVVGQHLRLSQIALPPANPSGDRPEDCGGLLEALAELPQRLQNTYLCRRLREALEHVDRKGTADELDEQLRYLSDLDAGRQTDSYALSRLIVWAIPILGFLGTVIGITMAISGINDDALAPGGTGMKPLTAALGIAF
ncbi:MAG: MotA/TolQ/ExbB proton channel family protein, partial [Planctomycetales bacterium]|nr:MotA/TolQ/ExbB proton channel family protein [Planctomycetales bacterium]